MARTKDLYDKISNTNEANAYKNLVYPQSLFDEESTLNTYLLIQFNKVEGSKFKSGATKNIKEKTKSPYGNTPVYSSKTENRASIMSKNPTYVRTDEQICLGMPEAGVQAMYGANWMQSQLGLAGRFVNDVYDTSQAKNIGEAVKILAEKHANMQTAANTLAGAMQGLLNFRLDDVIELSFAQTENPNVETLFKGVRPRFFNMTFRFTPRNKKEQFITNAIIHRFKFHAHPEIGSGEISVFREGKDGKQEQQKQTISNGFLKYPSTIDLTYMTGDKPNEYLPRFSTCAIQEINVNYMPDGKWAAHKDGAPPAIELQISLVELQVLTKDNFTNANASF